MKMNRSVIRWAFVALMLMSVAATSFGQIAIGVSVRFGPPAIPIYAQPICPGPGYFWTPGYWAWNDDAGYYWVPGTWVVAPVGLLWTPGYWGWGGGFYAWHAGYWGPHVGFYGGVNYGFGYSGVGFGGGEWRGRNFYYNRSVTNVSVTNVTNVYNRTVIVNENHVSYNGGNGGIQARPSREQENWARERHTQALAVQSEHERLASRNRENFAAENHGRPGIAATARPGDFERRSVVGARAAGGEYHAPAMSPREARVGATPGNRGNANGGFRPFTPPSKGGSPAANDRRNSTFENRNPQVRTNENRANETRNNQVRPNENRPNENRSNEMRPNEMKNNQARPNDNRPNENRTNEMRNNEMRNNQARPNQVRPNENRNEQMRNNQARPNQERNQERPNQNRPSNESRPAARPAENAPRENRASPPPAQHSGPPPKEERPREPRR